MAWWPTCHRLANGLTMELTAKQEAFAQAIVSGMSQADAYRRVYNAGSMKDSTIHVKACELMANGKVSARVKALRQPVIQELQYDLKQAMIEAADAMEVARTNKQGGAMVAAAQLRAKLNGLLVERKEIRTGPLDGMSLEEMQALRGVLDSVAAAQNAVLH